VNKSTKTESGDRRDESLAEEEEKTSREEPESKFLQGNDKGGAETEVGKRVSAY